MSAYKLIVRPEVRWGMEIWAAYIVDSSTKSVIDSTVFLSESAARYWAKNHK